MKHDTLRDMSLKKLEKSEVEFEEVIAASELEKSFNKILSDMAQSVELPGFRKGKAPLKMVRERVGDAKILDEAALALIEENYPKLINDNKIVPIGSPSVTILKIALGEDLSYRLKVATYPEFDLPDYKKIAVDVNSKKVDEKELEVSEKEVDEVLLQIRSAGLSAKEREDKVEPPALTDEMAASIGKFKSAAELVEKVKENIGKEKETRARDKKRAEIIEDIISKTAIQVPDVLVESELNRMFSQFASDVERMGMKVEEYLKNIKKDQDELFKEWRTDAEKSAKLQLIVNKISDAEDLKPEEDKVKREMEHLLMHHKDADPDRVRIYVETILTNEKVFNFLELQK